MNSPTPATADRDRVLQSILRWTLAIVLIGQATAAFTDTDIWGHMAFGLDVLQSRHLPWTDPYSFTSDLTWINHEWLWDVVTAAAYATGGLAGLLGVRAALITLVVVVVDRAHRGVPAALRMLTTALVIVSCVPQWKSTRPQMASLACAAVLFANLDAAWTPLLFVLWANVHGGWLYGLAAVALYTAANPTPRGMMIAAGCALATLATPYGVHLWLALADAVLRGWADVSEWQPIWRLAAGRDALVLWIALAVFVAWLWRHVSHDRFSWGWSLLALAAAANSRRLIGLAAVSCAVLLVPRWLGARVPAFAWRGTYAAAFAGAAMLAALLSVPTLKPSLTCFAPMPGWTAPEPDAVAFLRQSELTRVLPHFDFGEYAIFHVRDRMRVAIDNRRETVYSDAVVQANQRFTLGEDPDYPERIGADAVWWPAHDTRVIEGLTARGWSTRFAGPRTVVLTRTPGPTVVGRESPRGGPCFPYP